MEHRDTRLSEQYVLNRSNDTTFDQLAVELLGYDSDANVLRRVKVDSTGTFPINIDMATEGIATETTLAKIVGFAATDDLTITDSTVGDEETIVITNGVLTKTVVINNATDGITVTWT